MKRASLLALCFCTCMWLSAQEIPAGTVLPASLETKLDSSSSKPGQRVQARIEQDVPLAKGHVPAGSKLIGHVVQVNSGAHTLVIAFDSIRTKNATVLIKTGIRALASSTSVDQAQLPTDGPDHGSLPSAWTTTQVGDEVVYRGGGHVMDGDTVVGEPAQGGVLAVPRNAEPEPCRGSFYGEDQPAALWVFSSDACGVYGYGGGLRIVHAGRSAPVGQIELSGTERIRLYPGAGLLLRVLPEKS